ncbi:ATP-binding protein [Streptomyces subrutilus]|uniref:ATP-binding protein n=1 Tax=Streptomyces subrutilus TaxID=36818 RepID=UPI0033F9EC29
MRARFYPRARQTVPAARHFAAETFDVWGVTSRMDDMLLCVSELATNAVRHGVPPGRGYRLRLLVFEDATVRVEAHDSGPGLSRMVERPPGRGLTIVAALADAWGVLPRTPGKVVWCEFR